MGELSQSGNNQFHSAFHLQYDRSRFELEKGFFLLLYGFGCRTELIEEFCIQRLPDCPVIVVEALSFSPFEFGLQLRRIHHKEKIPGLRLFTQQYAQIFLI